MFLTIYMILLLYIQTVEVPCQHVIQKRLHNYNYLVFLLSLHMCEASWLTCCDTDYSTYTSCDSKQHLSSLSFMNCILFCVLCMAKLQMDVDSCCGFFKRQSTHKAVLLRD